jgi:hypothetical protein
MARLGVRFFEKLRIPKEFVFKIIFGWFKKFETKLEKVK